jgi:DHA1 family bicyclomycin/chloramphenicol resistance-like MFS transporter
MQAPHDAQPQRPHAAGMPGRTELIALMAMLAANVAFAIDAMLPALPAMAQDLSPGSPNSVQLVVTIFVLGMGVGTLFTGPLSDSFGRKPVILWGAVIYIVASGVAAMADSLEVMLAARLVQGLGASGPRIVAQAIIRDLFVGRQMAQIMSFVMIVFTLVPAVAPLIGAQLAALAGWPAIFWAFVVFAGVFSLWLALRLPETLAPAERRPFRIATLLSATKEMMRDRVVCLSIAVQSLVFGMLFAVLSSIQPIYEVVFDKADSFPLWMGATALLSATGSVVNALLVMRLGMRRLVSLMLSVQIVVTGTLVVLQLGGLAGTPLFVLFYFWQFLAFFQAGLTIGNLNAIAMEPMGHIAGMAASIIGAISTMAGVGLAIPIGLLFNGTPLPLTLGILVYGLCGLVLMGAMRRAEHIAETV